MFSLSEHLQELSPAALFLLETYFQQNWIEGNGCSLAQTDAAPKLKQLQIIFFKTKQKTVPYQFCMN